MLDGEWIKEWKTWFHTEKISPIQRLTLENAPVGPVYCFSGEPERDRSRKTGRDLPRARHRGRGAIKVQALRAWSVSRPKTYGKCRIIVVTTISKSIG